jgi:uncharacterized membrane protein HdeD (DUF308 family)
MKINESKTDRIIRIVLGALLLILGFFVVDSVTLGIVMMVIGGIALVTGIVGFCPLYALFKFSTNK